MGFEWTKIYKQRDVLHQKYVVEGKSSAQVAKEIGSAKQTVLGNLRRLDIEIRPREVAYKQCITMPKYGKKVIRGEEVIHLAEERTIKAVKEMKEQGFTILQICTLLDKLKIPTKRRGKKWGPSMVRRILERLPSE
jgi:hypothetical protein